ncbi:SURF1 family protein [Nesterenkonia xinjiangensis]|uniref:SURF1-like protein n=1 Tax=Nesterenkonia xinjiangensis TaxID=225327 RepID=A0A7Z0KB70_9MICC|nr:SURF1 family protein [Nesterenkonia xinjiangensis]NYJ79653.1 cytochrome oxidase assembly protein ShyY1 [Nesterenkonia xinjiangensis]
MTRYRFLLSPTWLGWLAVCVGFAVACVFLGQWQLDRREQAMQDINRVVSNYDEEPTPYAEVRETFHQPHADDEWTVTTMRGQYLSEDVRLVRNRGHSGAVGYEQVMPFQIDGGDVVVISRGWLPTDSTDASLPAYMPEPPRGEIELTVRLKPAEPEIDRGAPEGQLASLDLVDYEQQLGREIVTGAYGLMAEEDPAPAEQPRPLARPQLDEGPHLSYSMQWYAFGLLGFIGWGYAARLTARNRDLDLIAEEEGGRERAAGVASAGVSKQDRLREARRIRRLRAGRASDEDVEDAWVEERLGSR